MSESVIHSHIGARNVRALKLSSAENYQALAKIGIGMDERDVRRMMVGMGMDAMLGGITTPSVTTPEQFLQNWLPGFVHVVTTPRKLDGIVGITTAGSWEDEEIVQAILELTGSAVPYGDYTNIPYSSWNANFERRTVIRFEEGMQVGKLEEARASRINTNSAANKREAATLALEIERNKVGFYGYNGGYNRTYGFLNEPFLPAYATLPAGASGSTTWSKKTYQEITADIRLMFAALRSRSDDVIDPKEDATTMSLASDAVDFMGVSTDFGVSVSDWLAKTYPKCTVKSAPELNKANGGLNVVYLFAESVTDSSTDNGVVLDQIVPSKFQLLGVEQRAKGYAEDYSNATAGILCKRPFAVVRFTGV